MEFNIKTNELYKLFLDFTNKDRALKLFENIYPYMAKQFGEDAITINNFLFIQPRHII